MTRRHAARNPGRSGASVLTGVQALIFDFDGTIASAPYDFQAMRREVIRAAGRYGVESAGLRGLRALEMIERAGAALGPAGKDFRADATAAVRRKEIEAASKGSLLPGAMAALKKLRAAGYAIAVITRNCEEAVRIILKGRELPCQVLLARDHVRKVKPDPDHLRRAMSRLKVNADECLMVGDHVIDIEGGKAAGMRTVGVLTGSTGRREMEEAGAHLIARDVRELAAMLLQRT